MTTLNIPPGETTIRTIVAVIRALIRGGSNATGMFTLAANQSTTVVTDVNCQNGRHVWFSPATAHAAAEIAAGGMYIAAADIVAGQFTVHHANNAQADRTFHYETRS